MKNLIVSPILGMVLLWLNTGLAQHENHASHINTQHDDHGHSWQVEPISLMGAHMHTAGTFMFSYRYMPMWMDGNLQSTKEITNEQIFENYMVAPRKMQMNMHMLGGMYAVSDNLTLMVMGNYISNSMKLRTRSGVDFKTNSGGLGDITLSGLVKIVNGKSQTLHGNIGVSFPTGNIDQRDVTPTMSDAQLAYPMQLGSGTWDPSFGLTYLGKSKRFSWGAQSNYKFRLAENDENYTLGNRFDIVGWLTVKVADNFSFYTSLSYFNSQKIEGIDQDMNPMMMPLFNSMNSGRNQMDVGLGTNFYVSKGKMKDLRIAAEVKIPTYQKVNGMQMKTNLMATFGIQYAIGH